MDSPYILEETGDYAVVFKPPKTHSEGLPKDLTRMRVELEPVLLADAESAEEFNIGTTLNDWFKSQSGYNKMIRLMHRLDYETHGLVLFAKNEKSYLFFKLAQDNGEFIKEYSACIIRNENDNIKKNRNINLNGQFTGFPEVSSASLRLCESEFKIPFIIESYFRPYGQGRKLVRPVTEDGKKHKEIARDKGGFYRTEVINAENDILTVRIKRGFRHQIRCHLRWIGCPIKNDPLYSAGEERPAPESILALRAHALFFPDPKNGNILEYRIERLR